MRAIQELTREIETLGLNKTTKIYSDKLNTIIQLGKTASDGKRIEIYDEYVRILTILNLLVVAQGGPSTQPSSFEYFYGLPEQQRLL